MITPAPSTSIDTLNSIPNDQWVSYVNGVPTGPNFNIDGQGTTVGALRNQKCFTSAFAIRHADSQWVLFHEDDQISRLLVSAEMLNIPISWEHPRDTLKTEIRKTLDWNQNRGPKQADGSPTNEIQVLIFLATGNAKPVNGHTNSFEPNETDTRLSIMIKDKANFSEALYQNGIRTIPFNQVLRQVELAKSSHYLGGVMAQPHTKSQNAQEAIYITQEFGHNPDLSALTGLTLDEYILEGTTFSVFGLRKTAEGYTVITPPIVNPNTEEGQILESITRGVVLDILIPELNQAGTFGTITIEERQITVNEFIQCDSAFLTSGTKGPMPIQSFGSHEFGSNHELAIALRKHYKAYIQDYPNRAKINVLHYTSIPKHPADQLTRLKHRFNHLLQGLKHNLPANELQHLIDESLAN